MRTSLFAAVLFCGCSFQPSTTSPPPTKASPIPSARAPEIHTPPELEAEELVGAFSLSRKAAMAEYGGREVIVTGWAKYRPTSFGNDDGAYIVFRKHNTDFVFATIQAEHKAAFEQHFNLGARESTLRIKVQGVCQGNSQDGTVYLKNTRFIERD